MWGFVCSIVQSSSIGLQDMLYNYREQCQFSFQSQCGKVDLLDLLVLL